MGVRPLSDPYLTPWALLVAVALLVTGAVLYFAFDGARTGDPKDRERYLTARANHFDKLRALLVEDARELDTISKGIVEQGHYTPLIGQSPDSDDVWYPQLLIRDFASHFTAFAADREKLRGGAARLDTEFRALVRRLEEHFNLPA